MTRQARAIATRTLLLDCAGEVFAQVPYSEATIADVLARAGVTQGALYFHFKTKHDLAAAVVDDGMSRMSNLPTAASSPHEPFTLLIELARSLAAMIEESAVVAASIRLLTQSRHEFPEFEADPFTVWAPTVRQLLVDAERREELRSGTDIDAAAWLYIANFLGSNEIVGFSGGRLSRVDAVEASSRNLVDLLRSSSRG